MLLPKKKLSQQPVLETLPAGTRFPVLLTSGAQPDPEKRNPTATDAAVAAFLSNLLAFTNANPGPVKLVEYLTRADADDAGAPADATTMDELAGLSMAVGTLIHVANTPTGQQYYKVKYDPAGPLTVYVDGNYATSPRGTISASIVLLETGGAGLTPGQEAQLDIWQYVDDPTDGKVTTQAVEVRLPAGTSLQLATSTPGKSGTLSGDRLSFTNNGTTAIYRADYAQIANADGVAELQNGSVNTSIPATGETGTLLGCQVSGTQGNSNYYTLSPAGLAFDGAAGVIPDPADRTILRVSQASHFKVPQGNQSDDAARLSDLATAATSNSATYEAKANKNQPSGYPGLDSNGLLDPGQIPAVPIGSPIISSGGIADLTPAQYNSTLFNRRIVVTTDGFRWQYTGSGSKTDPASYIQLADITPEWSVIANKPTWGTGLVFNAGVYSLDFATTAEEQAGTVGNKASTPAGRNSWWAGLKANIAQEFSKAVTVLDLVISAATSPSIFFGSSLNLSRIGASILGVGNGTRNDTSGTVYAGGLRLGSAGATATTTRDFNYIRGNTTMTDAVENAPASAWGTGTNAGRMTQAYISANPAVLAGATVSGVTYPAAQPGDFFYARTKNFLFTYDFDTGSALTVFAVNLTSPV